MDKAGGLLNSLTPHPIGPSQASRYYAASHAWVFDTYEVSELSVARIRSILAEFTVPALPLSRLGVPSSPPQSMWVRDFKMGRHVLPVYSDLLYRLQHNALFFGYRLQHLPGTQSMCHHGCEALETAPHLFWYCDFAIQVWADWITNFQTFFLGTLEWESVLFFKLEPKPAAKARYGYSLFVVLHIVRAVIFRCLWLHRNDIRFHDCQANIIDVQARVKTVVVLHIKRYYQDLLFKSLSHSEVKRRNLQKLLASLHLYEALPQSPETTDH
ncbi:hypothetical protein Plhal304r1_c067g0155021 [Plasmopara halstedii]